MQDTAVLVVGNFGIGVQTASHDESLATVGLNRNVLTNVQFATLSVNGELLFASKTEGVSVIAFLELERKNTHADQVATMDTLI